MTLRLGEHWVGLHGSFGLNPHRAADWTLDEALMAEEFVERQARDARVAKATGRR